VSADKPVEQHREAADRQSDQAQEADGAQNIANRDIRAHHDQPVRHRNHGQARSPARFLNFRGTMTRKSIGAPQPKAALSSGAAATDRNARLPAARATRAVGADGLEQTASIIAP
jgi:hypothetical protein